MQSKILDTRQSGRRDALIFPYLLRACTLLNNKILSNTSSVAKFVISIKTFTLVKTIPVYQEFQRNNCQSNK